MYNVLAYMANKKKTKLSEKQLNILIIIGSFLLVISALVIATFASLLKCYRATNEAKTYLNSGDSVTVNYEDNCYTFSSKNNEAKRGLVFYQGAKVENISYAPLLYHFAKDTDTFCVLVNTPYNFPLFDINAADNPINKYHNIKNWYVAGHSQGGSVSSMYAANHLSMVKGMILLASYANANLADTDLNVALIYGDQDLVLNQSIYQNAKSQLPFNYQEHIIKGGNHAGFAMYGEQERDGLASISQIEQIQETVNFCKNNLFTNE